jgi:hypothetical protein
MICFKKEVNEKYIQIFLQTSWEYVGFEVPTAVVILWDTTP